MSLQSKRGLHAPPVSQAHEAYLRDHFVRAHPRAPGGSDPSTALVAAAQTGEVPGDHEVEVDEDFLIGSAEALQWLMWAKTPEGLVEEEAPAKKPGVFDKILGKTAEPKAAGSYKKVATDE